MRGHNPVNARSFGRGRRLWVDYILMDKQAIIERTRRWIAAMVIDLNLCPFARRVFEAGTIRYVVTPANDKKTLLSDLSGELEALAAVSSALVETTLLIHPRALGNFVAYNDFLDVGDQRVRDLGLRGVLQIASFHPHYQFAGTVASAVENYTNRSPYPMLHLLREDSITAMACDPRELLEIPERNIQTLRNLGRKRILEKLKAIELP
jgi:hypothetical protein